MAVDKIAAVPVAYMMSYPGRWAMDVLTGAAAYTGVFLLFGSGVVLIGKQAV